MASVSRSLPERCWRWPARRHDASVSGCARVVYVCAAAVDFRKAIGFGDASGRALDLNPFESHSFMIYNGHRDWAKVLAWEREDWRPVTSSNLSSHIMGRTEIESVFGKKWTLFILLLQALQEANQREASRFLASRFMAGLARREAAGRPLLSILSFARQRLVSHLSAGTDMK